MESVKTKSPAKIIPKLPAKPPPTSPPPPAPPSVSVRWGTAYEAKDKKDADKSIKEYMSFLDKKLEDEKGEEERVKNDKRILTNLERVKRVNMLLGKSEHPPLPKYVVPSKNTVTDNSPSIVSPDNAKQDFAEGKEYNMEESEEEKKILDTAAEINRGVRDSREFDLELTLLVYKIFCKKSSFQKKTISRLQNENKLKLSKVLSNEIKAFYH